MACLAGAKIATDVNGPGLLKSHVDMFLKVNLVGYLLPVPLGRTHEKGLLFPGNSNYGLSNDY